MKKKHFHFNALQTLAIGFAAIILIGAVLLMLPIANRNGLFLSFIDALFTSTSATCVTGLVIFDTYTQFTMFGQIVILILIQIGGLGFMTIAVMFSLLLRKRIGLKERSNLMESINSMQIGGVVRLAKRVLIGTAIIETIGAALLFIRFYPEFGFAQGIWFSIFHSVSAFCNAGFDLMGAIQPFASLTPFVSDVLVNVVMMILIIIGGLGFIVWNDIVEHKLHFSRYMLHTKIILTVTALILLLSTISFMIFEQNAAFVDMNFGEQLLAALFCSVTPRTAGFNTIDINMMSEAGSGLTMILMLIGAGPGSTAGGIKISTFIVIFLSIIAYIRGREDINIFGRRLEDGVIRRSFSSAGLYLFMMIACGIIILSFENFSLHETFFEVISAIGTVGLSKGITPLLSIGSQIGIIMLMFSGRVGSMSVAMAFVEQKQTIGLRNPVEKIIIG